MAVVVEVGAGAVRWGGAVGAEPAVQQNREVFEGYGAVVIEVCIGGGGG